MAGFGIASLFDSLSNAFSPKAKPSSGVLVCQAPPATSPSKPSTTATFTALPCDVQKLSVTIPGDGEDDKATFTASQTLVRQMPPVAAPVRLKRHFADYDLVLETVGPEAGRATGDAGVPSWNKDHNRNDLGGPSRSAGAEAKELSAVATWAASCADNGHKSLHYLPDSLAEASRPLQAVAAGVTLKESLYSRPLPGVGSLFRLVAALFDSSELISDYSLIADSCGRPASGTARGRLSALVRVFPKGVIGAKFSFVLPGGSKSDWSKALSAKDQQAIAAQQTKLQAASKAPAAARKGEGRAARAARKAETRNANRNRASLSAVTRDAKQGLYTPDSGGKRKIGWSINEGWSVEYAVIYADREISLEGAQALYDTVQRVKTAASSFSDFVSFLQDFTPSLVQPTVGVAIKFLTGDITVGVAHFPAAKGERFQAVDQEFFVELNLVIVSAEGAAGLIVGKTVLGTGMDVTCLVTLSGQFGAKCELTFSGDFDPEVEAKGSIGVAASGDFRASFAYKEIISASIEAKAEAELTTKIKLRKMDFSPLEWKLPPVMFVGNYRNAISGEAETRRIELTSEKKGEVKFD